MGRRKGRDHLQYLCVDRMMILKWILTEGGWEGVGWIHLAHDLRQVTGCCEYDNEPSGPGNFLIAEELLAF